MLLESPNRAQLVNFPVKQGRIPFHLTDDSSRVKTQRDKIAHPPNCTPLSVQRGERGRAV